VNVGAAAAMLRHVRVPRGREHAWIIAAAVLLASGIGAAVWGVRLGSNLHVIEYPMLRRTDIPTVVATGRDGAVWFTIDFADAIGVLRNRRMERIPKGAENLEPLGLAVDDEGNVWYTDAPSRAISRMSPTGTIASFVVPIPIAKLGRLALGPDGSVWFTDMTRLAIDRLKNGQFTAYLAKSIGATPFGVSVGADGTVWGTLQGANKLARIPAGGDLTEIDVPSRNSGLGDVVVDARGTVWFVETRANKIGRLADEHFSEFTIPTESPGVTALAVAPDGAVWFTELRAHGLGRLRNGVVTEFRLPRPDARPFSVAVDQANNVWYTDLGGWLGRLPAERATSK
jgi:virginiamycin B lyase